MTDYINLRKAVSGDIIVKCRFGDDIRRVPINQAPTYDELCLMMQRLFKKELSSDNITLKYMDNEGDLISLTKNEDIDHAISISNLLKVTVYDKTEETQNSRQASNKLRISLINIRDALTDMIDSFDKFEIEDTSQVKLNNSNTIEEGKKAKASRRLTAAELAEFSSSTSNSKADSENEKKSSVKEWNSEVPCYSLPTPQIPVQQQQQQTPVQQQRVSIQQQIPAQHQQYPIAQQQHIPVQQSHTHQTPQMQQQPPLVQHPQYAQKPIDQAPPQQQQQQQTPQSNLQQTPTAFTPSQQPPLNYPPPPTNNNYPAPNNNTVDPRIQQQRQQGVVYFGSQAPPSNIPMNTNATPPAPLQYRPPHW